MKKVTFEWEQHPNRYSLTMHLDCEVPVIGCEQNSFEEFWGYELLKTMENIKGLTSFWSEKYEITVCRARRFDESKFKCDIEKAVSGFLDAELVEVKNED